LDFEAQVLSAQKKRRKMHKEKRLGRATLNGGKENNKIKSSHLVKQKIVSWTNVVDLEWLKKKVSVIKSNVAEQQNTRQAKNTESGIIINRARTIKSENIKLNCKRNAPSFLSHSEVYMKHACSF